MTTHGFARFSFTLMVFCLLAAPLPAQDTQQIEVENSQFQVAAVVNSNAVYVRSGPSENDYPTMKLDKGVEITVVGERFNWLKIIPPEGSFCYVAKAYVNRAGNGSIGQVTSTLNVRVGSALNPLNTKVATKLEPNQRVEIVGEQNEYFKIKPPGDVYLYINKQFADPVRSVTPVPPLAEVAEPQVSQRQEPAPFAEPATKPTEDQTGPVPVVANPPATQPTAAAETEFDRLEKIYAEITQMPLDKQPVEELLAGYQALAANDALPESLRRVCDSKVAVLKNRAELKGQFVEVQRIKETMQQKQADLIVEQTELQDRIRSSEIKFFTAVGTLRTSSLQVGPATLYRLTDPANSRTVVYLRSNDEKLGQFVGQFIGVKGDVANDAQVNLRVITMSSYEIVNPAKVGQNIAAQIAPPSLLPGGATASTNE